MAHTEEKLNKLLNKIAVQHGYKNPEIIIKQIFSGGANYTSKLYTAIVKELNHEDLHLFSKVATIGEKMREQVPFNVFEVEIFFYTELIKYYQSLEEEHGVPEEHKLVFTKLYDHDPTMYNETLVLENLVAQGFGPCDRFKSVNWEYASSAVTELAKFHALSLAYKQKYPEEFAAIIAKTKIEYQEDLLESMTTSSVATAVKVVKSEHREVLENFLNKNLMDICVTYWEPVRQTVIIHDDYRGSNLLHRVREDGTVEIKVVDFQTIRGGCGVSDLLYFIFTGSDEQFRAQYYDKLVQHYYTELSSAMKRLHLDPEKLYPREDFEYELKEKLPKALGIAVLVLPLFTVETDKAPKLDENMDIKFMLVKDTSELFAERLNGIVNDYIKWGTLK